MNVITKGGFYRSSFEENFSILGFLMKREVRTVKAMEERLQSANKASWKDIKIFRNKDVPWRVKCRRLVDHVYPVFCFGSENWSCTMETMNKINRWETKFLLRLFRCT